MNETNRISVSDQVVMARRGKKGVWTAEFSLDGKHCRRSLKTSNQKVAHNRAMKIAISLAEGRYAPPAAPIRFESLIDSYLEILQARGRSMATLQRYRGVLRVFARFLQEAGILFAHQVTPALFDKYCCRRRATDQAHLNTIHFECTLLKQLFRWAKSRRLLVENPLEDIRLEKPKRDKRPAPTMAEVDAIVSRFDGIERIALLTLKCTGMRAGELRRLKPEDIDLESGWMHILSRKDGETKTRESRKVPIHPCLAEELKKLPTCDRAWAFGRRVLNGLSNQQRPIDTDDLNIRFQEVAKGLGILVGRMTGITLHRLRHFFETYSLNHNVPQRAVDAWLGHGGGQTMAARYYRLPDEESKRLIKLVPFGTATPADRSEGD